ncbi:DNA/RNA non-specific endonuclease [Streptomyces sp. NPDC004042]|uniref:DNA/RNA non-specific endonuclease n=1 Tax=Streptomyces sp. NPDC004042 TaxID=3154451 RepID=UPI0033A51CD6
MVIGPPVWRRVWTAATSILTRAVRPSKGSNHPATSGAGPTWGTWAVSRRTRAINACHLLGDALTGSGTDLRNLATCLRQANAAVRGDGRIEDHMFSYESQVQAAVNAGQVVHYTVTPQYSGARTIPVSFEITARGTMPDGSPEIAFSQPVTNLLYSPRAGWKNLGTATDSRTGLPVPTAFQR